MSNVIIDYMAPRTLARERFRSLLPPRARVLDLGCGPGFDVSYFISCGYKVYGVDPSERMLAFAHRIEGAEFECSTAEELDLQKEFEGIWARGSLIYVPRTYEVQTFKRISAHLACDGIFYACVLQGDEQRKIEDKLVNFFSKDRLTYLMTEICDLRVLYLWNARRFHSRGKPGYWLHCIAQRQ